MALSGANGISLGMNLSPVLSAMDSPVSWRSM